MDPSVTHHHQPPPTTNPFTHHNLANLAPPPPQQQQQPHRLQPPPSVVPPQQQQQQSSVAAAVVSPSNHRNHIQHRASTGSSIISATSPINSNHHHHHLPVNALSPSSYSSPSSTTSSSSSATLPQQSVPIQMLQTNAANDINTYDQLLHVYYSDPVDVRQVSSLDFFRSKSTLPNTVFEEVELFNSFERVTSPWTDHHHHHHSEETKPGPPLLASSSTNNNEQQVDDHHHHHHHQHDNNSNNNDSYSSRSVNVSSSSLLIMNDDDDDEEDESARINAALEEAVRRLFVQHAEQDDQLSPLLSFHMLLYKRMKILERVQEFQTLRSGDVKRLKGLFEHLPLVLPKVQKEETTKLIKELQKAMQRSDVKKGFFAKLRRSRAESVYKLLSKNITPYSMIGSDISDIQSYLVDFTANKDINIRKRSKAIVSLFLLALNRGSLLDVLMVLRSILILTEEHGDPLPTDESDDGGITLRPETLKALLQYRTTVANHMPHRTRQGSHSNWSWVQSDQAHSPQAIVSNSAYSIPSHGKKLLSIRRVFVFILSQLDLLCEAYLSGPNLLFKETKCLSSSFCIEPVPQVFTILKSMITRLLKFKVNAQKDKTHPQLYCLSALFRILRLNIEALSLWKQDNEVLRTDSGRLAIRATPTNTQYPSTPSEKDDSSVHSYSFSIPKVDFIKDIKIFCLSLIHNPKPVITPSVPTTTTKRQSRSVASSLQKQQGFLSTEESIDVDTRSTEEDFVVISRPQSGVDGDTISAAQSDQPAVSISSDLINDPVLFDHVSMVLCVGYTLFYPTHNEQRSFFIDSLRNINDSLTRNLFAKVLIRMTTDSYLFESFAVQGIGAKDNSVPFFEEVISLLKSDALQAIESVVGPSTAVDARNSDICHYLTTLTLMWQNSLLKTISGSQLRSFRSSTVPSLSLVQGAGKVLIDYAIKVFNSSMELLAAAYVVTDEETSENNFKLLSLLRQSIFGQLAFPLYHSFVKFLWRCGHTEDDIKQMHRITSFLYPFTVDMLRAMNDFSSVLKQADPTFDWHIVETDHPYESKLSNVVQSTFDQESVISVAVKFDPRSRTSTSSDNLRISANPQVSAQSLQFSGYGKTIPVNPLMTWGSSVQLNFTSDDKGTDWGMRCALLPIFDLNWFYEMQKNIGWLGGRCSTFILSRYPCSSDELKNSSWLNSKLFSKGLEDFRDEACASKNRDTFLLDLIHNRNNGAILVRFMTKQLQFEPVVLKDNEDINTSERAVIASILKHTDLAGLALRFTNQLADALRSDNDFSSLSRIAVSPKLLSVWRGSKKVRTWMVQKRQTQQLAYENMRTSIVSKAELLLDMRSSTFPFVHRGSLQSNLLTQSTDRDVLNESPRLVKDRSHSRISKSDTKGKEKEHMQLTGQPSDFDSAIDKVRSIMIAWRLCKQWKSKALSDTSKVDNQHIADIATLVLSFVQSDADPTKLRGFINNRKDRALSRAKAFSMYTELLTCTQFSSVKAEIIQGAKTVLRSRSMKNFDRVDFHYFNNTEGCGPTHYDVLSNSFAKFLSTLMNELEPTGSDVLLSGMLREILEACFISFKPLDIDWVLELNLLQKLCPLMFNCDIAPDGNVKFAQKSATGEERKEMSRRAWKLFRMLSVRSISMLEQWEEQEKNDTPILMQNVLKNKLLLLRDSIFSLLFDELENVLLQPTFSNYVVLEEMLSLMVSLCSTKSAQECLTTARFQALLLPLLKMGYVQVQELSLKLCSHLILRQKNSSDLLSENEITLVSVLFEFLGQFELHSVMGCDPFAVSETHNHTIGLNMAKQIFILLRKLFEDSSPECWTRTIKSIVNRALTDSFALVCQLGESIRTNVFTADDVSKEQSDAFKSISAAFTLLLGFSYIPESGEEILVDMNGKWMDARITLVEEDKHCVQVELLNDKTLHRVHTVPSENVRVKTHDTLNLAHVNINETTVLSLINFIECCGNFVTKERVSQNRAGDNYLLLFSNMWMRCLGVMDLLSTQEYYLDILLRSNKLSTILSFAEMPTQITYGKELKLDACSFSFTGKQFTKQHYYSCLTCGMSNSRAVCAVCARTCHRGHKLGNPEIGEFYCDCGAGEGKFSCKSLRKAPADPILTLQRMQSMCLRLQRLMPVFQLLKNQNNPHAPLFAVTKSTMVQEENVGPSCFKPLNARAGYRIDSDSEITYDFYSATLFSMLGSDYYIPLSWPGFYFEIEVVNYGQPSGTIALGLSEEVNVNKHWPEVLESSFTFHVNSGHLFLGTKLYKSAYSSSGSKADVIGCGWSKEHKAIFFTKNGLNLGNAFHIPTDGKTYFPVVILRGNKATIRANFGSRPFQFNLAKSYKPLASRPKSVSQPIVHPVEKSINNNAAQPQHDTKQLLREFLLLGFPAKLCEKAIEIYPNDPNSALSFLHRSRSGPIRDQLADQLITMGFEREMCHFALKLSQDDVNMALNWLLSENKPLMEEVLDNNEEQLEKGTAFIGADCNQDELRSMITKGLLLNLEVKVNENMFSDVQIHNVCIDDILVVNPSMTDEKGTNSQLDRMKSSVGVVTRKLLNGAYIQSWDTHTGTHLSSFVKTQNLLTPPQDLKSLSLLELGSGSLTYYKSISSMYCRKLLSAVFTNLKSPLELESTFMTTDNLYKVIKLLFVDQYHGQQHTFVANHVDLSEKLQQLLARLKLSKLSVNNQIIPIFDGVVTEALNDLNNIISGAPYHRRVVFKSAMNNTRIPIRFCGVSSICILFDGRCELSQHDQLTFYFDSQGRKQCLQFKGNTQLPRRFVICSDRIWFEFQASHLREGTGFQFDATPASFVLPEQMALSQPNLAVASVVLRTASEESWLTADLKHSFKLGMKYLLAPFVPFKGSLTDAVSNITKVIFKFCRIPDRPSLILLKHFRLELEDLHHAYHIHHDREASPLPIFHSMIDFMSSMRMFIAHDLCINAFPAIENRKNHFYTMQEDIFAGKLVKHCAACTHCTRSSSAPKYNSQDHSKCDADSAKHLVWRDSLSSASLVPAARMNLNPSDWFEHVAWVDQLAIVRELCSCFAFSTELPDWVLFEAALEKRKKVFYRESAHPYSVINDSGEISISGAKTIFISFDKHSKTHKSDRLLFSSRFKGGDDLGSYGGDELKDKTLIVHGSKLYYTFKSMGGDHECTCNNCSSVITGVRYHCTECDDYDLCEKCIRKSRLHNETHLFLKIRRPVDCVPASLPHLYPNRWICTAQFRGNVHVGVKCNGCGANPIRGVRYWCENCEDYNLCEKCADEEYKHHDRMHVFLRCIRPLPPKAQMPPNALPYGLVYEKEIDTHWGYMFSVSSSDSVSKFNDLKIQKSMEDIKSLMGEWNKFNDAQLVEYVENFCNGWQSLEWRELNPSEAQLTSLNHLQAMSLKSLRYRFIILKLLNRKLSRVLYMLNLDSVDTKRNSEGLSTMIANIRERIFKSVKMDAWLHTVTKSAIETTANVQPISLKLNRHRASEFHEDPVTYSLNSLFNQAYGQVQAMNPRVLSRKGGAWKVTFLGESADDYGGPFRESLTQICMELQTTQLDLLIPVPNQRHAIGENREKFIPNPQATSDKYLAWFRFMGQLLGIGLLSKNVLPLDMPSLFWKALVKEEITIKDLEAIDLMCYQGMNSLRKIEEEGITEDTFSSTIYETFTTVGSDGVEVELIKGGKKQPVTWERRHEYANMVEQYRLNELKTQILAIKEGLISIITPRFFPMFSWHELEMLICGSPDIDLTVLKKHTIYEGYTVNSREVKDFWSVLEGFDSKDRSSYLRFVWGRSRLPITDEGFTHHMKIQKLDRPNPDGVLPLSHTCFFSIELPPYSSQTVLKNRLLYAITHCKAIDTDFTTVATEARNVNVLLQ